VVPKTLTKERLVILAAAIALGIFLVFTELVPSAKRRAPTSFAPGRTVPVRITLVTADYHDLACAADAVVGGARCAFAKDGKPSPAATAGKDLLAPYMTVDNTLLLIPDLWSEPALAQRLAEESPEGKPRSSLKRFTAACQLAVDEKVKGFFVRWSPTSDWSPRDEAWSGRISGCRIE